MSELRALAKRIAAIAHINHRYNDGNYVDNHLERVALTAHGIAQKEKINDDEILDFLYAVSMLHDYLEDCFDYHTTTIEKEFQKLAKLFNTPLAKAVLILSRNHYQSDDDYLSKVSKNPLTKIIKAADRIANILSLHEIKIKSKREKLRIKYSEQLKYFIMYDIYPELIKKAINESDTAINKKYFKSK